MHLADPKASKATKQHVWNMRNKTTKKLWQIWVGLHDSEGGGIIFQYGYKIIIINIFFITIIKFKILNKIPNKSLPPNKIRFFIIIIILVENQLVMFIYIY